MTSPFAATLDAKETSSAALRRIEDRARASVRVAFADLSGKFTGMLGQVVEKNTEAGLSPEDVARLLTSVLARGLAEARRAAQSAHVSAGALGSVSAVQDLARLGITAPSAPAPDRTYLKTVLSDQERNVANAVVKATEALRAILDAPLPPEYQTSPAEAVRDRNAAVLAEVQKVVSDLMLRCELGVASVAHRAFTDAQRKVFDAAATANEGISILKVWVADLKSATPPCALCQDLHGTAVELGEEFPHGHADVYGGDLQGPPRHPNCRCRIVPHLVTLDSPEPEVPKLPPASRMMTAAQVRAMPWGRLKAIIAALKAVISKRRKR